MCAPRARLTAAWLSCSAFVELPVRVMNCLIPSVSSSGEKPPCVEDSSIALLMSLMWPSPSAVRLSELRSCACCSCQWMPDSITSLIPNTRLPIPAVATAHLIPPSARPNKPNPSPAWRACFPAVSLERPMPRIALPVFSASS
jgi:hypothetical protein